MWSSPLFWIVVAIAVFWALGAYNRLMRLRSAVVQAFGSFDAHMVRLLALLGEYGAAHTAGAGSSGATPALAALEGAATQLSASLAMARARPLQPDAAAALAAARDVLYATWDKTTATPPADVGTGPQGAPETAERPDASEEDPVSAGTPPASHWQTHWENHLQQNAQAARVFNDAVQHYNAAVAQFPASVLARVFGFKAARGLS
jgi:LemA protein